MTQAALVNDALLWVLIVMTLLLVIVLSVILAHPEPHSSPAPPKHKAPVPPPSLPVRRPPANTPPPPLPTRRPPAAAPTPAVAPIRAAAGWSGANDATQEFRAPVPMQNRVGQPKVSGKPPWDPAPKPPWLGR